MIVVRSVEHGEQMLSAGQLPCPDCGGPLHRHGHARNRTLRGLGAVRVSVRPRRAACPACSRTHVLLPADLLARRADTTEVIGTALAAKARGDGAGRIAAALGRPVSTVRRWLQSADTAHADWLYRQGVDAAWRIDRDLLVRPARWPTRLGDALNLLAGAALACRARLGSTDPVWTLIGILARGRLLPLPRT